MIFWLNDDATTLPDPRNADEEGIVAIGGNLSTALLLDAYRKGIFPWYSEEEPPVWWCPDPRFVLFPEKLKVSRSMKTLIRAGKMEFRTNTSFAQVIAACRSMHRPGQDGTWITDAIETEYTRLHRLGYAHCAETWQDGELVGGLYGIKLGNVFFGESMFSKVSNASKFAFTHWVQHLKSLGVVLIDCQVYTEHLESMGAEMIDREAFLQILARQAEL